MWMLTKRWGKWAGHVGGAGEVYLSVFNVLCMWLLVAVCRNWLVQIVCRHIIIAMSHISKCGCTDNTLVYYIHDNWNVSWSVFRPIPISSTV